MTDRNISKELIYSHDIDMENGNDCDSIDYHCLFGLLGEILTRLEKLEETK
jgi:hypothetical protein